MRTCVADGFGVHLANHDVMLWAVSRAPLEKLQAYKWRIGRSFPWAPSFGTDFNSDFAVYASRQGFRRGVSTVRSTSGPHTSVA
jgi:predicted dithiol-disulfide oxidoreductase (DUF899 family)